MTIIYVFFYDSLPGAALPPISCLYNMDKKHRGSIIFGSMLIVYLTHCMLKGAGRMNLGSRPFARER